MTGRATSNTGLVPPREDGNTARPTAATTPLPYATPSSFSISFAEFILRPFSYCYPSVQDLTTPKCSRETSEIEPGRPSHDMASLAPDRPNHRRSKSALALSLLHRDKSKVEEARDDSMSDTGSDAGSESGSPTAATASHSFRSSRKQRNAAASPVATTSSPLTTTTSRDAFPSSTDTAAPSIEQSVKIFKLFEVLRSNDATAIASAVMNPEKLQGTTILHLAIQCADPQVVEQIIAVSRSAAGAGVDFNARDKDGNTPLHLAALLGRSTTVGLLLEQDETDGSLPNYQGKTALDSARTPEIFQQLQLARSLYVDTKVKEIQILVRQQNYDELEKVLEESKVESVLDVNGGELATEYSTIHSGGTLLHEAARTRDVRLIQILLLHGADPFRRDRRGKLPQDVTKDERTRNILKKSPAAAAAQRGIQERAVLGNQSVLSLDGSPGGKDGREMKGYLKKWTNYTSGYKLRWFVLEDGVLSYYKHQGMMTSLGYTSSSCADGLQTMLVPLVVALSICALPSLTWMSRTRRSSRLKGSHR